MTCFPPIKFSEKSMDNSQNDYSSVERIGNKTEKTYTALLENLLERKK